MLFLMKISAISKVGKVEGERVLHLDRALIHGAMVAAPNGIVHHGAVVGLPVSPAVIDYRADDVPTIYHHQHQKHQQQHRGGNGLSG